MVEVIDILSSSPPRPSGGHSAANFKLSNLTDHVFDLGSDDFNITGDLDFAIEQPPKKRRIEESTHPPAVSTGQHAVSKWDSVFDLSSDIGPVPDIGESSKPVQATTDHDGLGDSDDLATRLSSSTPEFIGQPLPKSLLITTTTSDKGAVYDPIETSSPSIESSRPVFSQRTASLLASVRTKALKSTSSTAGVSASSRFKKAMSVDDRLDQSQDTTKGMKPKASKISSRPELSTQATTGQGQTTVSGRQSKAAVDTASKALKQAEKEAERERKRLEKELRQQEKQRAADIAEVNKSKTSKKNSTPEMILNVPKSLQGTSLANQVEEYMKELGVKLNFVDSSHENEIVNAGSTAKAHVIEWGRKVTAEYDEDQELWQPLAKPRLSKEEHVLIYLKAEDFISLAVAGSRSTNIKSAADVSEEMMKSNLDAYLHLLRNRKAGCRPIFLLEGLSAWLKKGSNAKNRAYSAAVRAQAVAEPEPDAEANINLSDHSESSRMVSSTQGGSKASSKQRRKSRTKTQRQNEIDLSTITESITETLLLHIQLHHQPVFIHHTTSAKTSASQISTFTQHLSTRPYRLAAQNANLASASFCMTTGQIRTGSTADEAWIQMLQEINRVTPSMAYGIVGAGYTNALELVRAFRDEERQQGGAGQARLMLEDVRKTVNKDGAWSDRRLGPMVSKRIHKVFMGIDPAARDGIA